MRSPLPLVLLAAAALPAQASWTQLAPAVSPGTRTNTASTADITGLLVFGGNIGGGVTTNELWRFDGVTWSLLTPAGSAPPPRMQTGAAYDLGSGRMVVFGGFDNGTFYGDTWEWDGANWIQHMPATSPSPRRWHDLVYDPVRQRVVLFGGWDGVQNFNDTWEWDGINWTLVPTATLPPARGRYAAAFDENSRRVVMFGGQVGTNVNSVLGDTWQYDGADWTQLTPATTPNGTGLLQAMLAFDLLRRRLVLACGFNGTYQSNTYEWDGTDWIDRGATPGLERAGLAMDYVLALGKTIVFGGFNSASGFLGDTWEYQTNAVASYNPAGSGCAGSAGIPALAARGLPWGGTTFTVDVAGLAPAALPFMLTGFSSTTFSGGALPFSLAPFGAPQCSLLVSPDATVFLSNVGGTASWSLNIPASASTIGVAFFNQGLVLEVGGGGALTISTTGRGDAVVGAL